MLPKVNCKINGQTPGCHSNCQIALKVFKCLLSILSLTLCEQAINCPRAHTPVHDTLNSSDLLHSLSYVPSSGGNIILFGIFKPKQELLNFFKKVFEWKFWNQTSLLEFQLCHLLSSFMVLFSWISIYSWVTWRWLQLTPSFRRMNEICQRIQLVSGTQYRFNKCHSS